MIRVDFKYKDQYTHGEWRSQHCICSTVEDCKKFYGLEDDGVEYEITSVRDLDAVEVKD